MQIYEKRYPRPARSADPTIAVTKWSYASDVDILVASEALTTLIKVSPELATKLGWALLEAAVAKPVPEGAA